MTDYNPIPDNILEPDDPISADLGIRWRDNPIAMFEGAPGAPGLWNRALIRPTVGAVDRVTATAGGGNIPVASSATFILGTVKVLGFGAMRLYTDGRVSGAFSGKLEFRRTRAGVTTTLASLTMTTTTQVLSVDVTFQPLDAYALWVIGASGQVITVTSKCMFISTGGEDLWLYDLDGYAPYFPILNNTAP